VGAFGAAGAIGLPAVAAVLELLGVLDQPSGLYRMQEDDARIECSGSSEAWDHDHRPGFGGDEEALGLAHWIVNHTQVQGLHAVGPVGRVAQRK
jgi:hypothetical protein